LRAANSVLPAWGFKQVEVTCDKVNDPKDIHTYWNVESHWNERCKFCVGINLEGANLQYPRATSNCTNPHSGVILSI
jgi:dolichyl-phosphate-mannose-protein mannosyltransferase